MKKGIALCAACLALVIALGCGRAARTFQKTAFLMDTYVTITVIAASDKEADAAIDHALDLLESFGKKIDFFSKDSELSAVNRNSGIGPVSVSAETFTLIQKSVEVARLSNGAFDPTIGPVISLWDFHQNRRPDDKATRKLVTLVGHAHVLLNEKERTVFLKKKGMMLDLGGIAKGFAADLIVNDLRSYGISSGLVAIAGDIRGFGRKADGSPWKIGIRNPRRTGEQDDLLAVVPLLDSAVSTAGDYERFFIENNIRYHHILDPSTGRPARECRSVSVISDSGYISDGFDNAVFVLGPEKGLALAARMGLEAVIVDQDGKIFMTDRLKEQISLAGNNQGSAPR